MNTICSTTMQDLIGERIWRASDAVTFRLLDVSRAEITDAGYTPLSITLDSSVFAAFSGGQSVNLITLGFGTATAALSDAKRLRIDRGSGVYSDCDIGAPDGMGVPAGLNVPAGAAIQIPAGFLTLGEVVAP